MKKNDETYIQIYLFSFLRKLMDEGAPIFAFSVPNGGSRHKAEAANLKLSGLTAGVPDICLFYNGGMFFIELKVIGGKLSPEQNKVQSALDSLGFKTHTIYAENPMDCINKTIPLLIDIGIDQNGISKSASSVAKSLGVDWDGSGVL